MGIISENLIGSNLNFAISNMEIELTAVPSNGETYLANKQDIEVAFEIFVDGREEMIETRFYINKNAYSQLPIKGTILTDGSTSYKVMNTLTDSANVTLRMECSSQFS